MKAIVNFFQDNAMFYKDITQWLRNRTFGSLFFGLLLVAEALSLFIIAGSDDIRDPGVSMFYILYMVLVIYAMIIAYLGNGLTSREFVNRTFELFELSGMSLERMIGGKVLSMLYQFFFGFFCLVPFMFFSYFLGGLDFFEMIVGVVLMGFLALPLYLISLMTALIGRFKQVNILTRLGSGFLLGILTLFSVISIFSGEPVLRGMVRALTDFLKLVLSGDFEALLFFGVVVAAYVQLCLLLFYLCCNSISRETDSREIPIKILATTLMLSWIALFAVQMNLVGYSRGNVYRMTVPIYLALLGLGMVTYYNRVGIPPIVKRRYKNGGPIDRTIFWLFQPGMRGGVRTLFFLIAVAGIAGTLAILPVAPAAPSSSSSSIRISLVPYSSSGAGIPGDEWGNALSLLVQIPWFLTVPYLLYIRGRELRFNYPGQRALMMATWVILGALVMIYMAWTQARIFGSSSHFSTMGDVIITILLSPLPSMAAIDSQDFAMLQLGYLLRLGSGGIGMFLMLRHLYAVSREEKYLSMEASAVDATGSPDKSDSPDDTDPINIPSQAEGV